MLPTQRSTCAFAFGARIGVRITVIPSALADRVEGAAELRVAVVDQEPRLPPALIEVDQ
jgi:hypothetical protein